MTVSDGSPLKSDATKVEAYGNGLTAPKLGPDNEFSVNANDAGKKSLLGQMLFPCSQLYINVIPFRQECVNGRHHWAKDAMRRGVDKALG